MHLKEGLCIKKVCLKTCPETFLNCFVLNTLSSKAKQLRNVVGHVIGQKKTRYKIGPLVFPKLILLNRSHDNPHHNDIISRYIYLPFQRMQ